MKEKHYSKDTVYFISYARLSNAIPAGKIMDHVGVGLVINQKSGVIEDISCTLLTEEAKLFLKDIIAGFNLHDENIEVLLKMISDRFHGMSQKSICVAVHSTYERYLQWKNK